MRDYHINIFYSEEDECYVADLPDFEYCSAFGETPAEALAELEIAKTAWLEVAIEKGVPIPEPKYRVEFQKPQLPPLSSFIQSSVSP